MPPLFIHTVADASRAHVRFADCEGVTRACTRTHTLKVDFKNKTADGRAQYEKPWISHTNIHAAPADLGALSPPGKDPLRKDSVSLTGGVGVYAGDLDLPEGEWFVSLCLPAL